MADDGETGEEVPPDPKLIIEEKYEPLFNERDAGARRKAADAALRRVGSVAQRLRPMRGRPATPLYPLPTRGGDSAYSDGMKWTAG